jgi:DNA-binding transcriptional regulator YiaG
LRAPQAGDAVRLRTWLGKENGTGTIIDVFDLRAKLGMTQRVFGAQFGIPRQQVQKWESEGDATAHAARQAGEALAGAAATVRAHRL